MSQRGVLVRSFFALAFSQFTTFNDAVKECQVCFPNSRSHYAWLSTYSFQGPTLEAPGNTSLGVVDLGPAIYFTVLSVIAEWLDAGMVELTPTVRWLF